MSMWDEDDDVRRDTFDDDHGLERSKLSHPSNVDPYARIKLEAIAYEADRRQRQREIDLGNVLRFPRF